MRFTKDQTDLVAEYFSDLSKILFASLVVGFFIPSTTGPITVPTLIVGTVTAIGFITLSISITK